jgi:hypothetical protein
MSRIESRELSERHLIDAIPVDQAAKDALFRAFSRSFAPSREARSKALAAVKQSMILIPAPHVEPAPTPVRKGWRAVWLAMIGRAR